MMKLFDCHCHIHLGPGGIAPLLENALPSRPMADPAVDLREKRICASWHDGASFAGAAVMSTHPRDYAAVDAAVSGIRGRHYLAVPCYGIHPWFLHEVLWPPDEGDGRTTPWDGDDGWLVELERRLLDRPDAIVGEIGLDGARWREVEEDDARKRGDEGDDGPRRRRRILSCNMDLQRRAFEKQLLLAAELQRPVSIHVVRAWGELFESLDAVRRSMERRHGVRNKQLTSSRKRKDERKTLLPPKIYFHAFSGKAGVVPSLLAACERGNVPRENVFFGFAPAIHSFYSAKTPSVMKKIGIRQLVLETDLEDASNMWGDLKSGVEGLAAAFDMDACEVAEQTYRNVERLYFAG